MEQFSLLTCLDDNHIVELRALCEKYCEHKPIMEEKDAYGNTPLLKACYLGRLEATKILLRFDADITTINNFGQNALTLATRSGNLELVRHLLQHRSYDEFNKSALIPAICVAALLKHWDIYNFFISLGSSNDQNIQTAHGLNSHAIIAFHEEIEQQNNGTARI